MAITRTINLSDLSAAELAEIFCSLCGDEQALFFAEVAKIAKSWPGTGWCAQAYDIAKNLNEDGRKTVLKLAEHILGRDDLEYDIAMLRLVESTLG